MEYEKYLEKVEEIVKEEGISFQEAAHKLMVAENTRYKEICGLWKPTDPKTGEIRHDSKVFAEKWISKEIIIPANVKIIAFKNNSENERAPILNLVWARD